MRVAAKPLLLLALVALAGCTSTTGLLRPGASGSTSRTTATVEHPSAESVYLAQLGAEQAKLAAAEQQIPTSPRTPAALAHSIDLLSAAVRRLGDGLAAIRPPAAVASQHAHLVGIIRAYVTSLEQAARIAVTPGGEPRAGRLLLAATSTASEQFTTAIARIDSTLGSSPT